jgi:hypothetical protein
LAIDLEYQVDGQELVTDRTMFYNKADDTYMVNESQWFASRIQFQNKNGEWIDLNIYDNDIGEYKAISSVFRLNQDDNISNLSTRQNQICFGLKSWAKDTII